MYGNGFHHRNGGFLKNGFAVSRVRTAGTRSPDYSGIRNVVENKVDLTKSRNLVIAACILVCGLGFSNGLTFHIGSTAITLTSLALAAIVGIVLNAILPGNEYQFESSSKKR